jgi:hypothetical protein
MKALLNKDWFPTAALIFCIALAIALSFVV